MAPSRKAREGAHPAISHNLISVISRRARIGRFIGAAGREFILALNLGSRMSIVVIAIDRLIALEAVPTAVRLFFKFKCERFRTDGQIPTD